MSFYFINLETIGKNKNVKKNHNWKNLEVQLINFYSINVKTIGKCGNVKKCQFGKIYLNPPNELLSYICRSNRRIQNR